MNSIIYFLGWLIILFGLFIIVSAIVGLIRFPDFYTKVHAASLIDACGIPISLVGIALLQSNIIITFKLVFAAGLLLLLSPVATHALVKAKLLSQYNSGEMLTTTEEEHE